MHSVCTWACEHMHMHLHATRSRAHVLIRGIIIQDAARGAMLSGLGAGYSQTLQADYAKRQAMAQVVYVLHARMHMRLHTTHTHTQEYRDRLSRTPDSRRSTPSMREYNQMRPDAGGAGSGAQVLEARLDALASRLG